MTDATETRESLLIRLRDPADAAAWYEFVTIYRPMVFRLAIRRGLQDSDAEDLTQKVLMSVSRAIGDWKKEASRGGFRSWLSTVARNAIINMLQRCPNDAAVGGSDFLNVCHDVTSNDDAIERMISEEHARSMLRVAAMQVQREVLPNTWQAFWRTAIEDQSPQQVADALQLPIGKIYGARSRVMKLLQRVVDDMQSEPSEDSHES